MRRRLRLACGDLDENELSAEDVDDYLNTSYAELFDKYQFRETEVTASFLTVAGERDYGLPTDFDAFRHLSVRRAYTNEHDIVKRITARRYEDIYDSDEFAWAPPQEYLREGCKIRIWPTPDAEYTMILKYHARLADLALDEDGVETGIDIPETWHELVLVGGIARALLDLGDPIRAQSFFQFQAKQINTSVPVESKEERDSPYAGLEVINSQRMY